MRSGALAAASKWYRRGDQSSEDSRSSLSTPLLSLRRAFSASTKERPKQCELCNEIICYDKEPIQGVCACLKTIVSIKVNDMAHMARGYDLALMSNLPGNKKDQAKPATIYLSADGYLVRDPEGVIREGSLSESGINLDDLSNRLKDKALKKSILKVTSRVGHTLTKRQMFMYSLGKVLAFIIAIGSGVTTAAAFVALNLVSAGAPTIALAILIFFAGFVVNWYLNRNSVPCILVDCFGKHRPFQTLMLRMKISRKGLMWTGILLSLCVGLTNAVLTYSSTFTLARTFSFLGASAFPPLAAVLGIVTLICLSATMFYSYRKLVKMEKPLQAIRGFLEDLFSIRENNSITGKKLGHNFHENGQLKSVTRRVIERALTGFLGLTLLALAALGLFMTMNASAAGFNKSLLRIIPSASVQAVDIAGKVICLVGATLGRIPFTVRNLYICLEKVFVHLHEEGKAAIVSARIGEKPTQTELSEDEKKEMRAYHRALAWYYVKVVFLYGLAVVNAIGNGLISIVGWGGAYTAAGDLNSKAIAAGAGGSVNSGMVGGSSISVKPPKRPERSGGSPASLDTRLPTIPEHLIFIPPPSDKGNKKVEVGSDLSTTPSTGMHSTISSAAIRSIG